MARVIYDDTFNDYIVEVKKIPVLSENEQISLMKSYKNGNMEARNKLIEHNLRLALYIVIKYYSGLDGMDLSDLVQEGNIGLMNAIDHYDFEKNVKISTYLSVAIRHNITKSLIDKSKIIRISNNEYNKILKVKERINKLELKLNRKPTLKDVADSLGVDESYIEYEYYYNDNIFSLYEPYLDDDKCLEDILMDDYSLEEEVVHSCSLVHIEKIMKEAKLSKTEYSVFKYFFGIDSKEIRTLRDVALKFDMSNEGVRKSKNNALEKIKKKVKRDSICDITINNKNTYK